MKTLKRIAIVGSLALATVAALSAVANAQGSVVKGIIDGRRGESMMVKSTDGTTVTVVLSDTTQVEEVEGGLHMRKKEMGLTALVPGLAVEVQGSTNAQGQVLADKVRFKASDLKSAQDIQAGVAPVEAQLQAQQQQMTQQESQIQQQQQAMQQQQAQLAAE